MTTQQTERELQNLSNKALNCDFALSLDSEQIKIFNAGVASMVDQVSTLLSTIAQQGEALEAARISSEWQSIETAPKDCAFLGYQRLSDDIWWIAPMYWSGNMYLILQFHSDNSEYSVNPTHWMPLPAPATLISKKAEG